MWNCNKCGTENFEMSCVCFKCQNQRVSFEPQTNKDKRGNLALMIFGGLLLLAGVIVVGYFYKYFDTTLAVQPIKFMGETYGGGRVHNMGLLQDRQNGIIIGIAVAMIGFTCAVIGSLMKRHN